MAGRRLFLYGSLRDTGLLSVVLGRPVSAEDLQQATLPDHAALRVAGAEFPVIVAEAGAVAEGALIEELGETDIARLSFYEGEGCYDLRPCEVQTGDGPVTAELFHPIPGWFETAGPFDLARWQRRDGALAIEAAHEIMSEFGQRSGADVIARHGLMRARAQSRLTARAGTAPLRLRSGLAAGDVKTHARSRPYAGFFNIEEFDVEIPAHGGGRVRLPHRTVFVAVDVVTVLPYDPRRDRVLLVEQFRIGPFARGDRAPWILEPVAGRRDPGETFEETARRETEEEAGVTLTGLERIAAFYPSPGCMTEYVVAYLGLAELPDGADGVFGVDHEGEDIRTHVIGYDALMEAVASGEAETAPLILSAFWLARNRDRLRADARA